MDKFYDVYVRAGFKALKCRGYNPSCKRDKSKKPRDNAKIPTVFNFTKKDYKGLTLEECKSWVEQRGWIGWVIPQNMIVLDVDDDSHQIQQVRDMLTRTKHAVSSTKHGYHFFLKATKEMSADSGVVLKFGRKVTYRAGGKNQLILAPTEDDRVWENLDALSDLDEITTHLLPLNKKNKQEVLKAINFQIFYYLKHKILNGLDIDFSYAGFLIDDCNATEAEFLDHFKITFKEEYDESRSRQMYVGAKNKSPKQSTGTLIKKLKENNLEHIVELIDLVKQKKKFDHGSAEDEADEVAKFFNKDHALIDLEGSVAVMKEYYDPIFKVNKIKFYKLESLRLWYMSLPPVFVTEKRAVAQVDVWLQSPHRKNYNGLCYSPGEPAVKEGYYNLWNGFQYAQIKGDCSLYLEHIKENISNGDEEIYEYTLDWMADAVQNLQNRPGVSYIMQGSQGSGKGVFASNFCKLFGKHSLHIGRPNAIVGRFNSQLMAKSIVFCDEAFWGGDKSISGILKTMISESTISIEYKGKETVEVQNYIRIIAASNNDFVVPAEIKERRYFVITVGDKRIGDRPYFKSINEQLHNGGYEALLDMLLTRDISNKDLTKFPRTMALSNQKMNNMEPVDKFLHDYLETGNLHHFVNKLGSMSFKDNKYYEDNIKMEHSNENWPERISKDDFEIIAKWWKNDHGSKYPINKNILGKRIVNALGGETTKKTSGYNRRRAYSIPELYVARENFEKYVGQPNMFADENDLGLE